MTVDLVIDVLAATRLTRLVTQDTFPPVKALRDQIVAAHTETVPVFQEFAGPPDKPDATEIRKIGVKDELDSWAELITCPWCAGMWVCFGVVVARRAFPRAWAPLAKALASSMVVGLIELKLDT